MCPRLCVRVCRLLLTSFYCRQPAAPTLPPLEYFIAAFIELSFIWPYRSPSLPVFGSAAFRRHWWHSSLDLAPNQRLFNVFSVIHEIGSIYEDLWKVSHLHPREERVWVFQAPLSALISFFHFSWGVYLGFKMWIIITPPKHIFSLRLDFREILNVATSSHRLCLFWIGVPYDGINPIFICMFFLQMIWTANLFTQKISFNYQDSILFSVFLFVW